MKSLRTLWTGAGFLVLLLVSPAAFGQQLFDSWITYGIDKAPTSIQTADMDGDGDLDLVIGTFMGRGGQPTVLVMENDGSGFFTLRYTLFPAPNSGQVKYVDVFDVDGDGDLDIMTAHSVTNKVDFFRSKGPGRGFELPIECRTGRRPLEVHAGFLDNDAFPELLSVNEASGTVSIFKNKGSGAYPAESIKVVGLNPRSLALFDMDNDGDNDFAVSVAANPLRRTEGYNGFTLFENQGNGLIDDSARVLYKIVNPSNPASLDTILNPFKILAADFNGDGFKDLALACSSTVNSPVAGRNIVCLFMNLKNGKFGGSPSDTIPSKSNPARYTVGFGCRSITASDVDGDGDLDIVSANQEDGTISVLKNNGNGTFADKKDFLTPNNPPSVVSGGDYDGDGDFDIATVSLGTPPSNPGNTFAVLRNKGNGDFEVGTEFISIDYLSGFGNNNPQGIAAGDLDGDGDADLGVCNQSVSVTTINKNNGAGSFPLPRCCPDSNYVFSATPRAVVAADLDGNGSLDLAVVNQDTPNPDTADVTIYRNNGSGRFSPQGGSPVRLPDGAGPYWITAGDLDGDGDKDLATANQGLGTVSVLKNNGSASFTLSANYPVGFRPVYVKAGDLDGDGDLDLVTADQGIDANLDSVSLLFNDGTGAFPVRRAIQVGSAPTAVALADLDGDGDLDLAVTATGITERQDTAVVIFKNDGSANFTFSQRLLPGDGPTDVVAADMNGDGRLDLVTADGGRSDVSFFANNGDGTFAPAVGYGAGISPRFLIAADLDGDGDLDLAVTNPRSVSRPPGASTDVGAFTVLTNNTVSTLLGARRGDLNQDNVYNLIDITQECNCIFLSLGVCTPSKSDVNCDGRMSALDVILLLQKVFSAAAFPC